MKKVIVAAALSATMATSAFAGGLAETVMPVEIVEAKTSSSAAGIIVPLLLIILIAIAASGSNGGGEAVMTPS